MEPGHQVPEPRAAPDSLTTTATTVATTTGTATAITSGPALPATPVTPGYDNTTHPKPQLNPGLNSPVSPETTRPRLTPDEIAARLASWKLTPAEHDRILHEKILPVELYPFLPAPEEGNQLEKPPSSSSTSPLVVESETILSSLEQQRQHRNRRRPVAVLVLGQTGAGKTRLAPRLLRALEKGPPGDGGGEGRGSENGERERNGVSSEGAGRKQGETTEATTATAAATAKLRPLHLIADTYKAHHPHYRDALALMPSHASALASEDAARWLAGVVAHAAAGGGGRGRLPCCRPYAHHAPGPDQQFRASYQPDILLEAACRDPSDPARLADRLARAGYRVRAAVLAVAYPLSRLGVLARYHRRLPEAGDTSRGMPARRLTPARVHDASFEGLRAWVGWVDGGRLGGVGGGKRGEGRGDSSDGVVKVVGDRTGAADKGGATGGKLSSSRTQDGQTPLTNAAPPRYNTNGGSNNAAILSTPDDQVATPSSRSIERIILLRRNSTVVYANSREQGRAGSWRTPAGAGPALDRERRRRLTSDERRAAEEDIAFLRTLGDAKVDGELDEIERMIDELGERSQGEGEGGEVASDQGVVMLDAEEFIWGGVDGGDEGSKENGV